MRSSHIKTSAFLYVVLLIIHTGAATEAPKLLLISFDGFRWDYLSKTATPNFDKISKHGVKAKWVKDSFVTVTFPNHHAIATGLHVESHGIVGNVFYDPVYDELFNMSSQKSLHDAKFWGGEPIWVTNQLQGGKSGAYYWPGCGANIKGVKTTWCESYVELKEVTLEIWKKRVDTVLGWLTDTDNSVNLAMLYFVEPDESGHTYGPNSPEIAKKIRMCDLITGYILHQLDVHGLDKMNIIITSDHGMTEMNRSKFITLDDHIDMKQIKYLMNDVAVASVWPKGGSDILNDVYKNLSAIDPDHYKVYYRKNIPSEYHYSNNRRIAPILMVAEEGWGIRENWDNKHWKLGRHGYNNSLMDMHPFFLAMGPSFKSDFVSEPFELIDIYPLMCYILGIEPAPNNGSLDAVKQILNKDNITYDVDDNVQFLTRTSIWIGICFGFIFYLILLIYMTKYKKKSLKYFRKEHGYLRDKNTKYEHNVNESSKLLPKYI